MTGRARKQSILGFSVVEISVVMAVIGILAVMVIIGIGAWRNSIATDEVVSDLNNVKAAMESARNFSSGYPLSIPTSFSSSANVQVTYRSGSATAYCIEAQNIKQTSVRYYVRATSGMSDVPRTGIC